MLEKILPGVNFTSIGQDRVNIHTDHGQMFGGNKGIYRETPLNRAATRSEVKFGWNWVSL